MSNKYISLIRRPICKEFPLVEMIFDFENKINLVKYKCHQEKFEEIDFNK
jgi:hypothetical protein